MLQDSIRLLTMHDRSMKNEILEKGKRVKEASRILAVTNTVIKNKALLFMAEELEKNREIIKAENSMDIEAGVKKGLSDAFIDRLTLNDKRIDSMIKNLHDVVNLKDPIGEIFNIAFTLSGSDL